MDPKSGEITELLNRADNQQSGADRLWELVYPELRRRAGVRGTEVPFKIPNLTDDPEGAEEFAKNARKMLQQ